MQLRSFLFAVLLVNSISRICLPAREGPEAIGQTSRTRSIALTAQSLPDKAPQQPGFSLETAGPANPYAAGSNTESPPLGESLRKAIPVVAADFNHDDLADLLIGTAEGLTLLFGTKNGPFAPGTPVWTGNQVLSLAAADFNGDGNLDVAAYCVAAQQILIFKGSGNGKFQLTHRLPVNSYESRGLVSADFNQDGFPDLAAGQFNGVAFYFGDSAGAFSPPTEIDTANGVVSLATADFNRDRRTDLLVGMSGGDFASLLLGTGGGTFAPAQSIRTKGNGIYELAVADMNGDGIMDVAGIDGSVFIIMGAGEGTFLSPQEVAGESGNRAISLAVGDLNGDGIPDAVVGNYYNGKIAILKGNGDGTLSALAPLSAAGDVFGVAIGDVNGDSKPDVAASSYSSSSALIAMNQGEATFAPPFYFGMSAASYIRALDYDRNGTLDVALFVPLRKSMRVLKEGVETLAEFTWTGYPLDARVADVNGDRVPDLLVLEAFNIGFPRDGDLGLTVSLHLGKNRGGFEPPVTVFASLSSSPPNLAELSLTTSLAVGDFNGDGNRDFAITNYARTILILQGNGQGAFQLIREIGDLRPSNVQAADVNGDGLTDLAVTSYYADGVTIILSAEGGRFQDPIRYSVGSGFRSVLLADFNGDSKPDWAAVSFSEIFVSLNEGGGVFRTGAWFKFATNYGLPGVAAGDFDWDGKQDLAVPQRLNDAWGNVKILRGSADKILDEARTVAAPPGAVALGVADWDIDGTVDLAVFSEITQTVTVIRGALTAKQ